MSKAKDASGPPEDGGTRRLREELQAIRDRTPEERREREREYWAEVSEADRDWAPAWLDTCAMTPDALLNTAEHWLDDLVSAGGLPDPLSGSKVSKSFDDDTDIIIAAAWARGLKEEARAIRRFTMTGEGPGGAMLAFAIIQDVLQSEVSDRVAGKNRLRLSAMDGLPEAPPERSIDQRTKKKARRPTEYDPVKGKRIYDDWQQQRGKGALAN